MHIVTDYFRGSFEKHGKEVYMEHYRKLEEVLESRGSGRYLSWKVEDCW